MLAMLLAALLGVAPQGGTVYTADGGRLRGTVLDAGAGGVTVQLADGTTKKLESAQVSRVDFADGTSWKPGAPAAAPAAAAVATASPPPTATPPAQAGQAVAPNPQPQAGGQPGAAVPVAGAAVPVAATAATAAVTARPSPLLVPVEKLDTVYLARGGRVRCLVTEEGPDGVVVRLVDGAERRYPPGLVSRIDWADGTRSDLSVPPPAPAMPAAAQAR